MENQENTGPGGNNNPELLALPASRVIDINTIVYDGNSELPIHKKLGISDAELSDLAEQVNVAFNQVIEEPGDDFLSSNVSEKVLKTLTPAQFTFLAICGLEAQIEKGIDRLSDEIDAIDELPSGIRNLVSGLHAHGRVKVFKAGPLTAIGINLK